MKGYDPGLYENLASFARQHYGRYQLIIGAADPNDPALAVATRLRKDFPRLDLTIVRGARAFGHNPKVENLVAMTAAAKYDLVLISDSNVRADPNYLTAMVSELEDPKVGLVSSVLAGEGGTSLGGALEDLQLNAFIASTVCAASLAGHPCVIGKSMLFRISALERLGGFAHVRDVLAEDYLLGQRFHRAGYKVALSNHVLTTVSGERGFKEFWNRHLRWHQMRRWVSPFTYMGEVILNPLPFLLLAAVATPYAWLGVALKYAADSLLQRRLTGAWLMPWRWPLAIAKDLLLVPMWMLGGVLRAVSWRGKRMWIGPGSVLGTTRLVERMKEAA